MLHMQLVCTSAHQKAVKTTSIYGELFFEFILRSARKKILPRFGYGVGLKPLYSGCSSRWRKSF